MSDVLGLSKAVRHPPRNESRWIVWWLRQHGVLHILRNWLKVRLYNIGQGRPDADKRLREITEGDGIYYVTQERAFAPGIAGEWPDVIPHPTSPHGRLVKREWAEELRAERASSE